jgi:6-phosphogluconolactonase
MRVTVTETPEAAAAAAADRMAAVAERGGDLSLAGGRTPRLAYELLGARDGIDWSRVDLWLGDERCVPATDPDSNRRLVEETLLAAAPAARLHPIDGQAEPDAAAAAYASELGTVAFDLALLGLGEDGHMASLFPGSPALHERERLAVAVTAVKPPPRRITLTFPVWERARGLVVLAVGAGKANAVAAVTAGPDERYPASLLPPDRTELLIDRAAAAGI